MIFEVGSFLEARPMGCFRQPPPWIGNWQKDLGLLDMRSVNTEDTAVGPCKGWTQDSTQGL